MINAGCAVLVAVYGVVTFWATFVAVWFFGLWGALGCLAVTLFLLFTPPGHRALEAAAVALLRALTRFGGRRRD